MAGRKWTPEERKAASDRAKAQINQAREAKNEMDMDSGNSPDSTSDTSVNISPEVDTSQQPQFVPQNTVTLTQEQFQMMLDRLARPETASNSSPTLNAQGGVVGLIERFPTNPKFYKNPVEELYEMPELRRFGMRENYLIEWKVTPTNYQTAQGTWFSEPRFELTLKRRQFDDNGKEITKLSPDGKTFHPRVVLGRASFFEDPPANIIEAENAGVSTDDLDKPEFQEKMRMYRYKFWLFEQLNPRRPQVETSRRREQVIGGRAYEMDDYSTAA